MRSAILALLLAGAALGAADVELQRIKLKDGGTMVGLYAQDTGTLQMFDERTGRKIGEMHLDPARVDSVSTFTVAVSDKPAAKPGADGRWLTDIAVARRLAGETKRPLLMLFTGSDWCPWCIKLERQILDTKAFKAWAAENVVLLYLDFPHERALPEAQQQANEAAAKQYGIDGFPTVLFTDAAGKKLWQYGYDDKTPEEWTATCSQELKRAQAK